MLKKITIIAPLSILALSLTACSHKPKSVVSKPTVKHSSAQVKPQKKIVKKKQTVKTAIFKARRQYSKRTHSNRRHQYRKPQGKRHAAARRYKKPTRAQAIYNKQRKYNKPRRNNYANRGGSNAFTNKLSNAALGRLRSRVRYDGSYVKIGYPWGDVPANIGVCTDVVIRSYRKLGVDLQSQVHNDMNASFRSYPNMRKWGLSRPDTNIDHRRVYNLRKFFTRQGAALPITRNPNDYKPGDMVTWMVGPGLPHIGVVVNKRSKADPRRFMIVHNIARGPEMEDILFRFPISGHYRYTPKHMNRVNRSKNRMVASRSRHATNKAHYQQLAKDAARIMRVHNRAPQRRRPAKQTNDQQLLAMARKINVPSSKSINKNAHKIELTQAKLVDLSTTQLSDLLKK